MRGVGNGDLISNGLVFSIDPLNIKSFNSAVSSTAVNDMSSDAKVGTLTNGASGTTVQFSFDGIDDYMSFSPTFSIEPADNSNMQSFSGWLYGTSADNHFFGSDASSGGQHHIILVINGFFASLSQPCLGYGGSYYGGGSGESTAEVSLSGLLNSSGWNHAAIVKTAAYYYDVYFNGVKVLASVYRNAPYSSNLQFGTWWLGYSRPSTIGKVSVWNRTLTSDEVFEIYQTEKWRYL